MYLAATVNTKIAWLDTLLNALITFINPMLIVLAVAGIIYAIVVGIKFLKAEDKNAREEAKQKLIYVVIGIGVVIVLIAVFYFLAFNIDKIIGWAETIVPTVTK